jgi:alginate O-acetyltransferase complex protein AlgI
LPFNSQAFLILFVPLFFGIYWLVLQETRSRMICLVLGSYVFYAFWDARFVALLALTTLIDYLIGLRMAQLSVANRRGWMWLGIAVRLGALAYFKYVDFGLDTVNSLFEVLDLPVSLPLTGVVLPVGISFYTFQALSYIIELGRGRVQPSPNLLQYAAYVAMFPQLTSGPIVRYTRMAPQLRMLPQRLAPERVRLAVWFVVIGLAKKVLLADLLAERLIELERLHPEMQFWASWGVMLAYALQLYFDFSGYSDIAIGLGHLLGLNLPQNFDKPYLASSLKEFWNRWHMSLSFWMRDYVFFPLSRALLRRWRSVPPAIIRTLSQVITMGLIGLWHGASVTMIGWGLYHGILLALGAWRRERKLILPWQPVNQLATFLAVLVGWALFRADSFDEAGRTLAAMAGLHGIEPGLPLDVWGFRLAGLVGLGILLVLINVDTWDIKPSEKVWQAVALGALGAICVLVIGKPQTFLYFRY